MDSLVSRARARPIVLVGLVVAMLLLLWLQIIPPNGSPDEKSHFVRLGGIASGHPFGTPPAAAPPDFDALTPAQIERVRREAGIFHVGPHYLYLSGGDCNSFYSDVPACAAPLPQPDARTAISEHAHSQIVGYLLPAALSRVGWSGRSTFYLARLGTVLVATMLLMLGFISVRRAAPGVDIVFVAAGAAAGITPLVAFLGGAIAPAIIGTFGAIALCMCTWAIAKTSVVGGVDRVMWIVALTAACASASVGVPFAILAILAGLVAAWAGPKRLVLQLGIAGSIIGAAVVVGAGLWDLAWRVNVPATESVVSISTWTHNLHVVFTTSRDVADQLGWLDVSMPMVVKLITAVLFLSWVVRALLLDNWRFLLSIGALVCGFLAIAMALTHSLEPTGFGPQARYFLPAICVFPILAALRLLRLSADTQRSLRPGLTLLVWGFGMTCAMYALLRRHVVGAKGPIWFFGHGGAFRPLGGWLLPAVTFIAFWVLLALLVSARPAVGDEDLAIS